MYVIYATQTPYGKKVISHRTIPFPVEIAERHVKRLNALKAGQGKRKTPLHWSRGTPEWFTQQVDQGRKTL